MSMTQAANLSATKDRSVRAARFALFAIVSVWVGAAMSGNLIAAPAKFQAPSLTLPVALDVGRMQFLWIGVFEAFCALTIAILLFLSRQKPSLPLFATLCVFGAQRLWLLPVLDERTLLIIAGHPVEESSMHLLYVGAELLKITFLIWANLRMLRDLPGTKRWAVASVQD